MRDYLDPATIRARLETTMAIPTPEERAELRRLRAEATQGEWRCTEDNPEDVWIFAPSRPEASDHIANVGESRITEIGVAFDVDQKNGRLLCAAVNALPTHLDAIDALEAQVQTLTRERDADAEAMASKYLNLNAARLTAERERDAQALGLTMLVQTIGGSDNEGNPTHAGNYLQRVRVLVQAERERDALRAAAILATSDSGFDAQLGMNRLRLALKEASFRQSEAEFMARARGDILALVEQVTRLRSALVDARDVISANRLVLGEYQGVREIGELEKKIAAALAGGK